MDFLKIYALRRLFQGEILDDEIDPSYNRISKSKPDKFVILVLENLLRNDLFVHEPKKSKISEKAKSKNLVNKVPKVKTYAVCSDLTLQNELENITLTQSTVLTLQII